MARFEKTADTVPISRRKRFERSAPEHPLTPVKLALLRHLAECSFLTVPQLADLAGSTPKALRGHMRHLFDMGLVERVGVPRVALEDSDVHSRHTLLFGSAPMIYHLSKAGARTLVAAGMADPEEVKDLPAYGPHNSLFLAHATQVRDVRVWLEVVARTHALAGIQSWMDGARTTIGRVQPDAWFTFPLKGATLMGLLEIDRGTERRPATWIEKFAQYREVLNTDMLYAATGHRTGRVLVIVPSVVRRETLAQLLADCLSGTEVTPERFMLAHRADLQQADLRSPIWHLPGVSERVPLVPEKYL